MTSTDEFMTPKQLCDLLQVPLHTLYKWNHLGTGPRYIAVGRHVRYRRSDVDAWLEQQASTTPGA